MANRVLGLIRRTFGSKDPVPIKTAFNALVRPILGYACPEWNPYLVKHIHSIEFIQRHDTRLICGFHKSYSKRLTELNWSTMEHIEKYLCLVQLYKIIAGCSDIDYTMWICLARQELGVTMTLKPGLEQQGQTSLTFHFLIVTLMTGTLYQTPLCLLPA